MEKHTGWIAIALLVIGLIVGVGFGYAIANDKPAEVIQLPGETITNTIVKEVEGPTEHINYIDGAVSLFIAELEEDDDLLYCDEHEYDEDEVSESKVYDSYVVSFDDEDHTVDFSIKLKYKEEDKESCKAVWDVSVFYEEDEDPELSY